MTNDKTYDCKSCQFCGAPATRKICPYCGNPTGLEYDIAVAEMEYQLMDCNDGRMVISQRNICAFIAVIYTLISIFLVFTFNFDFSDKENAITTLFFIFIYAIVGIGDIIVLVYMHLTSYFIKKKGKEVLVTVGDIADARHLSSDGKSMLGDIFVKFILDTNRGKRIILHKIDEDNIPYFEKTKEVKIMYYKKQYILTEEYDYECRVAAKNE